MPLQRILWSQWSDRQIDRAWSLGLGVLAIALFTLNLGGLALRDWDEGLVAQVAREIDGWQTWLYPTLWGEPYLNKPPLVHGMVAIFYRLLGVSEWSARLPGALLTAISVPLLYGIGREIFQRRAAVFAALIYLTSLPVIRNGRLAMLDGATLCFLTLLLLGTLRSRRDSRYTLLMGVSLGLICLTKGVMMGVLLGAIALLFLAWDTPRLLKLPVLWLGLLLGNIPVALWYGAQWLHYGQAFWGNNLVNQSLQRIWTDVEQHGGAPWFYLLEVLKHDAPWILFLPMGCKLAWENRSLSWAKLAIVWGGLYLVAISLMATKLPWYVLPLYPALALIQGAAVSELWQQGKHIGVKQFPAPLYSRVWVWLFTCLALVGWVGVIYFGFRAQADVQIVFGAIALTLSATAVLLTQRDSQFLPVLIWGTYVSLLLFVASGHWVWELAEAYPVKPVAALIQQVPVGEKVYTSYPYNRPSLNFYSDRPIHLADPQRLKRIWRRSPHPYLLLDKSALTQLNLRAVKSLGEAEGWTVITRVRRG
ncbi:MAG: glycosyltransferase family 39 protein [Drouetiella hepatica Uher 2000/2452]|jgi:4-amino-4-deoxy-L-arabinose transferase-like glycosyltransferase|uniref:Glycosyltransferase family 39 protein n=1 Tax=Drouetiella hepatica Uher 2000/2452 TaxID=904376 RepID=A0A951UR19_9CYAN|nr:glycosyltransferase family 39 protein [Drouetiella hepatica Uher 2000/2452]